jgi:hypothetical protein
MFIGNIITTSKIDDENFKVCRKIETIEEGLPTLIIGWDKTKEIYGDKVSILHKQIDENTYWTFSPKERKIDFDNDLDSFFIICYSKIGEKIHYIYIDLIHDSKKKIKKILRKIYSLENPKIYIHKDRMVYIYSDGMIFGIDLEIVNYIGIKKDKVITKLNNLSGCRFIDMEIFNKYKTVMTKINNKVRLIPYLYDIENSDG